MKKTEGPEARRTKEDAEAKAIQAITQALLPVPDERKGDVLAYVAARYKVEAALPRAASAGGAGGPTLVAQRPSVTEDIEEFMEQRNPKNHYQRVAALAYFLDRVKGTREFGSEEMEGANDDAHGPKLGNLGQILADAANKYGFIAPGSQHGKRRLTLRGKKVAEALPDQEAVKKVMREYGFRAASGGRRRTSRGKKQG